MYICIPGEQTGVTRSVTEGCFLLQWLQQSRTQISWQWSRKQDQKGIKSRLMIKNSPRKALLYNNKENVNSLSSEVEKLGNTSIVSPSYQSPQRQLAIAKQQEQMAETAESQNSSSTNAKELETTSETNKTSPALKAISIWGLNNPLVSFKLFSFYSM